MATVTKISIQAKNKSRVNVFLDGEFACGLDSFIAEKNRLREGTEIEREELIAIQRESEAQTAFEKCVDYINMRMRTEREIEKYLAEKGYAGEIIDEITAKLKEYSLIDDMRFCELFISSHRRAWGVKRLKIELKKHGVSDEDIASSLEEAEPQHEEALAAAEKFCRNKERYDRNKLYAHLYSKGFDYDCISYALREYEENLAAENEEDDV